MSLQGTRKSSLLIAALSCALALGLAACGTTSSLQAPTDNAKIDLTPYSKLLVETSRTKPRLGPSPRRSRC